MKVSYRWYEHIEEKRVRKIIDALNKYFGRTKFFYEDVQKPKNDPRGELGEHRPYRGFQFEMSSSNGSDYTWDRDAIYYMCSSGVTGGSIRGFILSETNLTPSIWVDSPHTSDPDFVPLEAYVTCLLSSYGRLLDRALAARRLIAHKTVPKHPKLAEAREFLSAFGSQGEYDGPGTET